MSARTSNAQLQFQFAFEGLIGATARAVTLGRAWVHLDDEMLAARFGPWIVSTPRDNVGGAETTGPYSPWKVVGPPHLSFADRGLTFATNARRGVCIRFRNPVAGLEPFGRLRHPALTVTVLDPDRLVEALRLR